ncbi:DUF2931 family protein [Apibacter sp. HY039]|uniref:DUF2931 family protein n=1 Tax=Apibacter sp. HY039 TaxID=2501476 RepID=UPI000FEB8721|nr:DUF2931 family protein [Apibacter sp. HY039]
MNQVQKILLITGCILLNISLFSCQKTMEKNYKFTTNAFCADGYGMHLYHGYFSSPGEKSIPIYTNHLSGPWGAKGGGDVIGSGLNPVPDSLHIGFYSDSEDKFYEGDFALPYEKIVQLFEEDSEDPDEKGKTFNDSQSGKMLPYRKYNGLTVSVTPGGKVYLWIFGPMDQVGLGVYQAKEVQRKWRDIFENGGREETVAYYLEKIASEKVKKEIATHSLPYTLWDSYRERFLWKYVVEGAKPVSYLHFKAINAEEEGIFPPRLGNDQYKERAVPYWFRFYFTDAKGKGYYALVYFTKDPKYYLKIYKSKKGTYWPEDTKEEQAYWVFKQMEKDKPIDLVFKVGADPQKMTVWVRTPEKEVELTDIIVYVSPYEFKK